ncbi:MAG: T9SS type A sorting domain-containing protein, partial [Bacteroidia bacterium]
PLLGTNGIIVSPQPASTSVQLQFNNPKADNYSLYIYSLTGKLIHQESKITSNQYRIDSSNFPAGYYVYLLRSDYKTHQGKISITH